MSGSVKTGSGCEVKLAGSESKDKMYEPKHKKKLVRVLTVIAYVFSVSLAAITLSLFYIFIYNPDRPANKVATRHYVNSLSKIEDERTLLNRTTWLAPEEPRALPIQIAESQEVMHDLVQLHSNQAQESWENEETFKKALRERRSLKSILKGIVKPT